MTRPLLSARRNPLIVAALAAGFCHFVSPAHADWTHYRGPTATGVSTDKLAAVPKEPKQLWKASVGVGASSMTVSGEHVFTMGNVGGKDTVWCLNAATGAVVWKHEYPLDFVGKGCRAWRISATRDPLAVAERL